jgi:lipoprotein signal peptidase
MHVNHHRRMQNRYHIRKANPAFHVIDHSVHYGTCVLIVGTCTSSKIDGNPTGMY